MASTDTIPIIDFSSTTNLAAEIKQVCETWGFLYVKNHGLPQSSIDRMFSISSTFFKTTPKAEKQATPWNSIDNAGYDANTGTEDYFKENGGADKISRGDGKEVFVIRKEGSMPNQPMPAGLKALNPEIQTFMKDVHEKIAVPLLGLLADGLDIPAAQVTRLHEHARPSMTTLRLIHYPALGEADDAHIRLGSHTDQGVITILFQNDVAGLQVRPPKYSGPIAADEVWLDAPVVPGAVLINIGETMTFFSGGLMKSTLHRVARSPRAQDHGKDRFSMAYFCHPNVDTALRVLEGLEGKKGVQPREAPVSCVTGKKVQTVKDWIEHRHSMGRLAKVK